MSSHLSADKSRDPWPLLLWLRVAIGLEIVIYLGLIIFIIDYRYFQTTQGLPIPRMQTIETMVRFIFLLQAANLFLFLCVALIGGWLTYRTTKNAIVFGKTPSSITPFWSVAWYFVPIANLVMPPRALAAIWRGTFGEGDVAERRAELIRWWWAATLISALLDIAETVFRSLGAFNLPERQDFGFEIAAASYTLAAIAAFLFLRIFTLIARGQSLIVKRGLDKATVFE